MWGKIKRKLSVKHRVCVGLCGLGLDVRIVKRNQTEEKYTLRWTLGQDYESLGLIEIRNSPIRWVSILRTNKLKFEPNGDYDVILYVVPDAQVSAKGGYRLIESVQDRSVPMIGRITGINWKCRIKDRLVRQLNDDTLLNERLAKLEEDITVRSFPEYQCWSISTSSRSVGVDALFFQGRIPSRDQWDCYEMIAHHLLNSSGE